MKNFWKKKKESYQEHTEIEKSPQIAGHGGLTRVDTGNRGPRPSYRRAFAKAELTEHLPGAAALTQQDRGGARREGSGDAAGAEEDGPCACTESSPPAALTGLEPRPFSVLGCLRHSSDGFFRAEGISASSSFHVRLCSLSMLVCTRTIIPASSVFQPLLSLIRLI